MELTEGVANGNDLLAGMDRLRVAELDGGQILSVGDFEEGDVAERVRANEFNVFIARAVVEDDSDVPGAFDDVLVGQDIAVGGNNHTGAGSRAGLALAKEIASADFSDDRNDAGSNAVGDFFD